MKYIHLSIMILLFSGLFLISCQLITPVNTPQNIKVEGQTLTIPTPTAENAGQQAGLPTMEQQANSASAPTQTPVMLVNQNGNRYAVVGVEPADVLNMRSAAGISHPVVTEIPPFAIDIQMIGPEVNVDDSVWSQIQYKEHTGWVNKRFLARLHGSPDTGAVRKVVEILDALRLRDYSALSAYIHPHSGVRFSPYVYIHPDDKTFFMDQVAGFITDTQIYTWGIFDGSGEPIEMTVSKYFDRFVYDAAFAQAQEVFYNSPTSHGNMINNTLEAYPSATIVEYYFAGFDPQYEGMDWRSLRLALEQLDGTWYLVGIIHDEWTT